MQYIISMKELDRLLDGWGAKRVICDLFEMDWGTLNRYLNGTMPMPLRTQLCIVAVLKFTDILERVDRLETFTLQDLEQQWAMTPFRTPPIRSNPQLTRSYIRKRTSWRVGKSASKRSVAKDDAVGSATSKSRAKSASRKK